MTLEPISMTGLAFASSNSGIPPSFLPHEQNIVPFFALFRNEEAPYQYLCACVLMEKLRYTEELSFCARTCHRRFKITFVFLLSGDTLCVCGRTNASHSLSLSMSLTRNSAGAVL